MIPSDGRVSFSCSFPYFSGLPQEARWVGLSESAPQRDFMQDEFSRSSLFLTFRPPGLLATQVSPIAVPYQAHRTAVTFTPEQITHRYQCAHRVCWPSEQQATDGERTSTFLDSRPCRPLPTSRFIRLVPPRGSLPASAELRSSSGCPLTPTRRG
jgi:hypothetical protein